MASLSSMARSPYGQLQAAFARVSSFEHAINILKWDSMTKMPISAGHMRSAALAELEAALHAGLRDPDIPRLVNEARVEIHRQQHVAREAGNVPSNVGDLLASLREMERTVRLANAVDPVLVKRKAELTSQAELAWRAAKQANNWSLFKPHLEEVISASIEEARQLAAAAAKAPVPVTMTHYDALLDKFEPGMTSEQLSTLFDGLLQWLPAAAKYAADRDAQLQLITISGEFAISKQYDIAREVMAVLGFDLNRGRLDEAMHPFCGGVPQDVRLTTKFNHLNPLDGLFAVIHEAGHGRYEQNLPVKHASLPVGKARSMGIHESQSLLCEMHIARGDSFLQWLAPRLALTFGDQPAFEWKNLRQITRKVARTPVRIYADELTYPLHIAMRYQMERDLVSGALKVGDIPSVWRAQLSELLGVELAADDYARGCLQDIHWSIGAFGYFPTYVLGAVYASQFMKALTSDLGGTTAVDATILHGDHAPIINWLRQRIWSRGCELPTSALVMNATGEPLNFEYHKQHLYRRYLSP